MRKDIEIQTNIGDVVLTRTVGGTLSGFEWVSTSSGMPSDCIYGEVTIPYTASSHDLFRDGVYVNIPYIAVDKPVKICFRYSNFPAYCINPATGGQWFDMTGDVDFKGMAKIRASQLPLISLDTYFIRVDGGNAEVYSGYASDFSIVKANSQNKWLMLVCSPGNSYRYPLSGVGLIRWANSGGNFSQCADVLQREFTYDGTPVTNASYDYDTEEFAITLDTSQVD